mmetsp:Transcript_7159/g.24399  ORF Transcript_7159/g.24399 Transcript_7159/m.24399 type:complete len:202 (-) Transcript_7159:133-738(-)
MSPEPAPARFGPSEAWWCLAAGRESTARSPEAAAVTTTAGGAAPRASAAPGAAVNAHRTSPSRSAPTAAAAAAKMAPSLPPPSGGSSRSTLEGAPGSLSKASQSSAVSRRRSGGSDCQRAHSAMPSAERSPRNSAAGCPWRKKSTVGYPLMSRLSQTASARLPSSLANGHRRPPRSTPDRAKSAARANSGMSAREWPHQGA